MRANLLDSVREQRRVEWHDILETRRICELIVRHGEANAA
jgi:hypothetical protein